MSFSNSPVTHLGAGARATWPEASSPVSSLREELTVERRVRDHFVAQSRFSPGLDRCQSDEIEQGGMFRRT